MHASVLCFHSAENNIEGFMNSFLVDNQECEEFVIHIKKNQAKRKAEKIKQINPNLKDLSVEDTLIKYNGYSIDEEGNFGYTENPQARMDYYTIGGMWANSLPFLGKVAKTEHKHILSKKEEWRERINDYALFKYLKPEQALAQFGYGTSVISSYGVNPKRLSELFMLMAGAYYDKYSNVSRFKKSREECMNEYKLISKNFCDIFCENEGWIDSPKESIFVKKIKEWSKRKDGVITVVDYHI
jgi:hypothetical protein